MLIRPNATLSLPKPPEQAARTQVRGGRLKENDINAPRFLDRIRAGEPGALQAVVRAYVRQIFHAARSAGLDNQQAEDATQSTFLTFIEKARGFEGRSKVRTWLFGILRWKIVELRRMQSRRARENNIDETIESRFDLDGSWMNPPRSIEAELYRREAIKILNDCLEDAPTRQRIAFVLREVEGLPTIEVREILAVTPTNLGALLYRARNRLRECLEDRGITSRLQVCG